MGISAWEFLPAILPVPTLLALLALLLFEFPVHPQRLRK